MKRAVLVAALWITIIWTAAFLFQTLSPDRPDPTANPLFRWDAAFYAVIAHDESLLAVLTHPTGIIISAVAAASLFAGRKPRPGGWRSGW